MLTRMIRTVRWLLALALIAAACGGAATDPPSQTAAPQVTTTGPVGSPDSTAAASPTTTSADTPVVAAQPSGVDGPAAPDFSLKVDDGSTFVLSQEAKPVYLVFWAEW